MWTGGPSGVTRVDVKPTSTSHACPRCGKDIERTGRRTIDRALSIFVPVLRFRCTAAVCEWEGNIKRTTTSGAALRHGAGRPTVFLLSMAFVACGVAVVMFLGTTGKALFRAAEASSQPPPRAPDNSDYRTRESVITGTPMPPGVARPAAAGK